MRPTPFWVLAALAIGLPALVLGLFSLLLARSPDNGGPPGAILGLLVLVLALFTFVGLGAWALVVAKPGPRLGRVLRRIGLVVGFLAALGYGLGALFGPGSELSIMPMFGVFLLLAAATAFYALVSDFWPREARSEGR